MAKGLKDIFGGVYGGLTGGLGALFGGLGRRNAANNQIKATRGLIANVDQWRDQYANDDGTQSIAAQNVINENRRMLSRAARAAAGRKAVTGVEESPEVKESGAAQTANLLAGVAAAQQQRNNAINDQAQAQKLQLQQQINEIEAGKPNTYDMINGVIAGTNAGIRKGMGLQNLYSKQV